MQEVEPRALLRRRPHSNPAPDQPMRSLIRGSSKRRCVATVAVDQENKTVVDFAVKEELKDVNRVFFHVVKDGQTLRYRIVAYRREIGAGESR